MPDKQFVKVTYGEVDLVPKGSEGRTRRQRIGDWLSFTQSVITRLAIILFVGAVVGVTLRELMRSPVIIEEIGLPTKLSERGYTGVVTAHRLWDAMLDVQDRTKTVKSRTPLIASSRQLDVVAPGTGLSVQGLAQIIRSLLNLKQTRISGEILCQTAVCTSDELVLRLRIFIGDRMEIVSAGPAGSATMTDYFAASALMVMEVVDPYVVAALYYDDEAMRPRSVAIADRLIRENHPDAAWAANLKANGFQTAGDHTTAIKWYQRAVELAKDLGPDGFPLPWNGWANSLGVLGRHEEAIAKYRRATEVDPEFAFAWNGWGISHAKLEQHEKAIDKYRQAIAVDPDYAFAWNSWGNTLGALGRDDEAIEKYRRATEIDPDYANAWNGWGNRLAADGHHEEAIEKHRRATEVDPEHVGAWNGWGNRLGALGQHEESIEKYRRATEIDPEYAHAWNGWGNRLGDLGRHEEAIEKYRRATEMDADYAYAWNNWGLLLLEMIDDDPLQPCRDIVPVIEDYVALAGDRAPSWFAETADPFLQGCKSVE